MAYFTYITHGDSVASIYPVGSIQHNLDNTWDIFPESWLCGLIFGSINIHATHHCFPTCSRSELLTKSRYLAKRYPRNYRSINTFQGLYNLYKNFADKSDISVFETSYKEGISWGEAKEKLFQVINAELMPIRSKYLELEKDTDYINDLLSDGAKKARSLAKIKILEIKEVTGITKIT